MQLIPLHVIIITMDNTIDNTQTAPKQEKRLYTKGEEIFNAVSHIVGAAFGVFVLIVGVTLASIHQDTWAIVAMVIYGISMVILYTASSIYHFLRNNRAKKVFRVLDHCSIFILIAGTYTPFTLIALRTVGLWGWAIFSVLWLLAILGIIFNAINMHHKTVKKLSLITYLAMGWSALVAIVPIIQNIHPMGILWTLIGGIMYTAGVYFFIRGKRTKYFHSIWHLFILAGSLTQFIAIIFYIILV